MPLKASCHCGAIQLEMAEAPATVTSCNCSLCAKRGALWAYCPKAEVKLLTVRERVASYQWGHYVGVHHHCAVCGCSTHSEFPDFSSGEADYDNMRVALNARLFGDDFDLAAVPVRHVDGRNSW